VEGRSTGLLPDPELEEHRSQVAEQLALYSSYGTEPEVAQGLFAGVPQWLFHTVADRIGASEGTLWFADDKRSHLTATVNPFNPTFVGFQQPIDKGFISMVFATEQSLCENEVYRHEEHDSVADLTVRKVTYAMIATPFYLGGEVRGILSFVQHKDDRDAKDPEGFSADHLGEVKLLARALTNLAEGRLLKILMGLGE